MTIGNHQSLLEKYNPNTNEEGDIFHEILLSYFVLIRNSRKARKYFKRRFNNMSRDKAILVDPLLEQLCTGKADTLQYIHGNPRLAHFSKSQHFPMLSRRFSELQNFTSDVKPENIRGVYKDKRDLYLWYTFWAVIFYGTFGLILSIVSTALTAVQTAYAIK